MNICAWLGEFEEIGEKWISSVTGDNLLVVDVKLMSTSSVVTHQMVIRLRPLLMGSQGHGGAKVDDVEWIGLSTAIGLLRDRKVRSPHRVLSDRRRIQAIFLDCRERWEFEIESIAGAHSVSMREFVDYGLSRVHGDWVGEVSTSALLIVCVLPSCDLCIWLGQIIRTKSADPPVPIIIYSSVATPFSRCRALCRWLLRAGSGGSLNPSRLRRLRGG